MVALLTSLVIQAGGVGASKPAVAAERGVEDRRTRGDRLNESDAARYRRIFAAQEAGNFDEADSLIKRLDDGRLMGHVLQQRYLSSTYKATYDELAAWMKRYSDHPGAHRVFELAFARRPAGAPELTPVRATRGVLGYRMDDSGPIAQPYMATQKMTPKQRDVVVAIGRSVAKNPTGALRRLEGAKAMFTPTQYDALKADIATSYFYNGNERRAYELASASANRSGEDVPQAGWIAGLSAWRMKRYEDAARYFERAATSPRASAWMISGAAHWAARSYLRGHQPEKVSVWLRKAAEHPRSFYGIISAKALGMEQSRFHWDMPSLRRGLISALAEVPAGMRALALVDAGQNALAEQELRQINPDGNPDLQEAMMAFAHTSGAPAIEMRLGSRLTDKRGDLYDAALYPESAWQPEGGYIVDKALVHAFIRQESKFEMQARNKGSGAFGVMQLMPATARAMADKHGIKGGDAAYRTPKVNIALGQYYLAEMLGTETVKDNLFKLAAAYNAGPGKLARWIREVEYDNDPLLFVESIPVAETRAFVERVMTNYWIYRIKYGQNTDSLERVAAGDWPLYPR